MKHIFYRIRQCIINELPLRSAIYSRPISWRRSIDTKTTRIEGEGALSFERTIVMMKRDNIFCSKMNAAFSIARLPEQFRSRFDVPGFTPGAPPPRCLGFRVSTLRHHHREHLHLKPLSSDAPAVLAIAHTHTHALTHTHTHTHTHTTESKYLLSRSLSHTHTHTQTLSHTLTHTHTGTHTYPNMHPKINSHSNSFHFHEHL